MPKIILTGFATNKGIDNFFDFAGIYNALKSILPTYTVICLIYCDDSSIKQTQNQLRLLKINEYYLDHHNLPGNPDLQKHFREAEQIILTSANFPVDEYRASNKNIPYKCITEHEVDAPHGGVIYYLLGLGNNRVGMKLQDYSRRSPTSVTDKLQIVNELLQLTDPQQVTDTLLEKIAELLPIPNQQQVSDEQLQALINRELPMLMLLEALLNSTNLDNFAEFHRRNFLIPTYFEKPQALACFLLLFTTNQTLPDNKDFALCLFGDLDMNNTIKELEDTVRTDCNIKTIELHHKDNLQPPCILAINPTGNKVVRIFCGFSLTKKHHLELCGQAPVIGVSESHSLEIAISSKALPWGLPENLPGKKNIYRALAEFIEAEPLAISPKIKQDFISYFLTLPGFSATLDLTGMIENWHIIAKHLIDKCNFHKKFKRIVEDHLPQHERTPASYGRFFATITNLLGALRPDSEPSPSKPKQTPPIAQNMI